MAQADNTVHGRHYHDAAGVYLLPNDALEHDRLDGQSQSLVALMNGKPFHAPISKPKKILDVGCGTGSMTYLLARMYPNAQVIGVDFSAVPDGRYTKLENVEYVQADIWELVKDGTLEAGSFDYIFERLLFLGMTDWEGHLSNITGLLRPGGWLEVQEPSVNLSRGDGSSFSESWWHYPKWRADAWEIGVDVEVGPRMVELFGKVGGLEGISQAVYRFPPVSRSDRPELNGLGDRILPMLTGVLRKTSRMRRSEEEVDQMESDLRAVFEAGFEDDDAYEMYVVTGRKVAS